MILFSLSKGLWLSREVKKSSWVCKENKRKRFWLWDDVTSSVDEKKPILERVQGLNSFFSIEPSMKVWRKDCWRQWRYEPPSSLCTSLAHFKKGGLLSSSHVCVYNIFVLFVFHMAKLPELSRCRKKQDWKWQPLGSVQKAFRSNKGEEKPFVGQQPTGLKLESSNKAPSLVFLCFISSAVVWFSNSKEKMIYFVADFFYTTAGLSYSHQWA